MRDRSDWYFEDDPFDEDLDGARPAGAPEAEGVPGKVSKTTAVARQLHRMSMASAGPAPAGGAAGEALAHARAHATPTPLPHRERMEQGFGRSFGDVEVLGGSGAERAAGMVDAVAFAVGNTMVLPRSPAPSLVAHELTHVVQQSGARVAPGADLEVTDPAGAAEREADAVAGAVARGAPAPAIGGAGGQVARLARTPAGEAAAEEEEEPGVDWKAVARRATSDEESKLFRYTVEALEKKKDDSLQTASRKKLCAEGRTRWREAVGDDVLYLLQLAAELGDEVADRKVRQVCDESDFDPEEDADGLRRAYFEVVVAKLNNEGSNYVDGTKIYDANGSAFTDALEARFRLKGRTLEVPNNEHLLYRTTGLSGFFWYNLQSGHRDDLQRELEALVAPEHHGQISVTSGTVPSEEEAEAPPTVSTFDYWVYTLAEDPSQCGDAMDLLDTSGQLGGQNGTTWWSYNGVELKDINPAELAGVGLQKCLDLFALDPKWYPDGAAYITADAEALHNRMKASGTQLRKPTALDGIMSYLWTPATVPDTEWGITGGGAPEAVAPFLSAEDVLGVRLMIAPLPSVQRLREALRQYGSEEGRELLGGELRTLVLELNPTFELLLPSGAGARASIPAPPILHPGVVFSQLDLNLGGEGGAVTGGTATMDVRAGGAFGVEAAQLEIRPSEGGARVDNEIPGVASPLGDLLGRFEADAHVTDTGVAAELRMTPGPSGIPGFNLEQASIEAGYSEGQVTAEGRVGIAHESGKMTGNVGASWDGGGWIVRGEARVEDLVDGLDPFSVTLERKDEQTVVRASEVAYRTELGAIELRGKATDLQYDVDARAFSGSLDVDADLGMLGEANAAARMANNEIEEVMFSLASKELSYPAGDAAPLVRGTVNGEVGYREGAFAGSVTGQASVRLPGVAGGEAQEAAGLEVEVGLTEGGNYTGSIKAASPVQVGEYLRIDEAGLELADDGSVSGKITANLLNIPFLERGQITWAIEDGEVSIESVDAHLAGSLGMFGADRLHLDVQLVEGGISGTLTVDEGPSGIPGLDLGASEVTFSYINGQMTASGSFELSHESGLLEGDLSVAWDDGWTLDGGARIEAGLVPGLSAFQLRFSQEGERLRIYAPDPVSYDATFGAIKVEGTTTELEYDTEKGSFSGSIDLGADLGMFGTASATGTIVDNELASAEFTYESPQLRYPPGSDSPILSSDSIEASLRLEEGKFSGSLSTVANLRLPDMLGGLAEEATGIAVNVEVGEDGSYSGSVRTTGPVTLGTFLRIDALDAEVESEGGLSGTFTMNVVNVPMLKKGEVVCRFSGEGIEIERIDAEIAGNLEALGAERVDVSLRLTESGIGGSIGVSAGPSGIPGFSLEDSSVEFMYTEGQLTASGRFGFSHDSGKISGGLELAWDGSEWTYKGDGTVADLIPGLEPFTVEIEHGPEGTSVSVEEVVYERTFGAITLRGRTEELSYDVDNKSFGGNIDVTADLGMLGTASAQAEIKDNQLEAGALSYDSPELKYPPGSDSPLISGTIGGTVTYAGGQFSGSVRSSATVNLPGLLSTGEDDALAVDVNVQVGADGSYSGSLRTTQPVQIGQYFRIQSLQGELTEDGEVSSEFTVDIVNLSFLNEGSVTCAIDKDGFRVVAVSAEVPFGTPDESRAWGKIRAGYSQEEGFLLQGDANVQLTDDMVATGAFSYATATNEISAELGVAEITLFSFQDTRDLFSLVKQIPLVSFYNIVGIYLDLRFELLFRYLMELKITPTVTLEGLNLDDFSFDRAAAKIDLDGELGAALDAIPGLGVGIFAVSPKILRGGGGLKLQISAESKLKPSATIEAGFSPDGGIDGDATVAMPLTFGISGSVLPWAEVSVLDGVYEKPWEGDSLADFTILPETELFNFTLDLGGDLSEQQPELPDAPTEPAPAEAAVVLEPEEPSPTDTSVESPEAVAAEPGEQASDEQGFKITDLLDQLLGLPQLSGITELIEAAGAIWESIKNFVGSIVNFVRDWVGTGVDVVKDALEGIKEHGVIGYVKVVLRDNVDENIYYMLEPMLDAMQNTEEGFLGLFDREPPSGGLASLRWVLELMLDVYGLAFNSFSGVVSALGEMFGRARDIGGRFLNYLVREGRLGVWRHSYWVPGLRGRNYFLAASEYKVWLPGGFGEHFKQSGMLKSPRSAAGQALWLALERFGDVPPTHTGAHSRTGAAVNHYWVGGEGPG